MGVGMRPCQESTEESLVNVPGNRHRSGGTPRAEDRPRDPGHY